MLVPLNILVNTIINTYFIESRCVLIYESDTFFKYEIEIPQVLLNENCNKIWNNTFHYFGCQAIVIATSDPVDFFMKIERQLKLHKERFNFRKYLFIPTENAMGNLTDIFQTPAAKYVTDLLAITKFENSNGNTYYNLITHRYVTYSFSNEIITLDTWFPHNESFLFGANLFPNKIENQMGRALKIATFTYRPYSVPSKVPENSDGIEMRIALLYAKRHNITVELLVDESGQWGVIYDNWTGEGIIGNLAKDLADIGFGALYTWEHEYHFLDLSKPTLRTGITLLVPAPTLAGGWMTPLLSFSWAMWIAVLFSFALSVMAIFTSHVLVEKLQVYKIRKGIIILKKVDRWEILQTTVLMVTGSFVQQSVSSPVLFKHNIATGLFGCIWLLILLIASSYSSGLASSMTIPRFTGAIHTVTDFAESGLYWGATSDAWILSIMGDKDPTFVTIVSRFIIANESELALRGKSRFGYSVERLQGDFYAVGNYIDYDSVVDRLRLLHEDLYWEQSLLMMKKSSVLLPSIDKLILEISQAGLLSHMEFDVVSKHLDNGIQRALKYSRHHHEKNDIAVQLNLSDVEGAFLIYLLGIFLSILIFCKELSVKFRKQ